LKTTNFQEFLDGRHRFGTVYSLLKKKALYDGEAFYEWIKAKLADKGVHTFKDLRTEDPDPKYKWKLKVIAADISEGRMLTLPDDIVFYDMKPDDLEVAFAVRMSMSLPYYFKPIVLKDNYIVDGGLLSNFPIWLFDSVGSPTHPTFGILLDEDGSNEKFKIDNLVTYAAAMIKTLLRVNDRKFIRPEDYEHRTMRVPTGKISTAQFDLSAVDKDWLYHSGLKAALGFFVSWSFDEYVKWANKVRGVI
jgi:NTE family protein